MSKVRRATLCLVGVLCLSFAVVKTASARTLHQYGPFHIATILDANYFPGVQGFYIYADVAVAGSPPCSPIVFFVDGTKANYKAQSAMAMAAYLAGKPVYVNLDTDDLTCNLGASVVALTISN